jgi:hypothetical protein
MAIRILQTLAICFICAPKDFLEPGSLSDFLTFPETMVLQNVLAV